MFRSILPRTFLQGLPTKTLQSKTSLLKHYPLSQSIRSLFIQTETTPNVNALKFKSSRKLLPDNETIEVLSKRESINQPLAFDLFQVDGVKGLMIGSDFITIEKEKDEQWGVLKPEIFMILTEFISSNKQISIPEPQQNQKKNEYLDEDEEEVIEMIKELIETRIRPTIQEDGGDLSFEKFENGTVYLKLKGACRSCESSSLTLKTGIESMLKHYIEEVENVEQLDETDEEAEKMEKILMEKKKKKNNNNTEAVPPSL